MVWLTTAAILCALTEAESCGYCWDQAVDLSPMMPVGQFQVMEEGGAYLCTLRALVFEGSILTYNPTLNEAEWVPSCGLANDLFWAEERSAVGLEQPLSQRPTGGPHLDAESMGMKTLLSIFVFVIKLIVIVVEDK